MTDTTPAGTTFDVERAGAMLAALLEQTGPALALRDPSGRMAPVRPETAGAADGLLPVFLVAADAVWREATGKGFSLDIRRDAAALLGYRAHGIGAGTFATVLLSTMEAIEQARQPDHLVVNDLIGSVWKAVLDRADAAVAAPPFSQAGAHP